MNTRPPAGRLLAGLTILVLLAGGAAGASPTPTPAASSAPSLAVTTPGPTPVATATPARTQAPMACTYGPVTVVAGTSDCPSIDFGTVTTDSIGVQHARGGTVACAHTVNDPG